MEQHTSLPTGPKITHSAKYYGRLTEIIALKAEIQPDGLLIMLFCFFHNRNKKKKGSFLVDNYET